MVKTKAIKPKEKRTIVSNKKKDRDQFIKEMDMLRLKQKINEIMKKVSNDKTKIEENNIKYKKNIQLINEKYTDDSNKLYQNMFQKYIKNEFTLVCISFVNKIIIDIKRNHLEQYEGKYNFNKLFIALTKELLLNEFELILLSLYLEYIDISLYLDSFSMEDSLLFLCYFIKKLTINNNQLSPINSFLNKKYDNFEENYNKWYKVIENKINNKLNFSYLEINDRYREFNIPFNAFCGDNFIDYNYIVDRILTMSLPYVDVKKDNNTTINNNNSIISGINNNIEKIDNKNNNENKNNYDNNDSNNNYINNNYINNNYINNNYINHNKININVDEYKNYNKQILQPEPFINVNNKSKSNLNTNIKNENLINSNYNIQNANNNNNIIKENKSNNNNKLILNNSQKIVTPNNLLHSLSNLNRYILNPGNNKMLINPNLIGNINNKSNIEFPVNSYIDLNKQNLIHSVRQIEEDFGAKKIGSNLIINPLNSQSQSSFIFQQKPSLMEINLFNRNNSSHFFDDEGETLKQILRASSDNYFRSSMNLDSPKYPYVGNITNNNLVNINNNGNNNNEQKVGDNIRKYNNDIPFRPLNLINNKSSNNILNPNKIIFNNNPANYGNINSNNNPANYGKINSNNNYDNNQNISNDLKK